MRIRIVSYTKNGRDTAERAAAACEAEGHLTERFALQKFCLEGDAPLHESASEWAKAGFLEADALIFCCASGIAVRAVAPWVFDKTTDPAVLVIDERGRYVIPLLSGHIGGANELALSISERIGAEAVLTTATDINGLFAVDVFAKKNHLYITDLKLCKSVSAALLSKKPVGFRSDLPFDGPLPAGLTAGDAEIGIYVGNLKKDPYPVTLHLVPKRYAAGIGCRKDKPYEELKAFFERQLLDSGICAEELLCVASIDLKRTEQGILELCEKYRLPLNTYSAQELNAVTGDFSGSRFVRETTGVDCVCERAAVLACGGSLCIRKIAEGGMTFALAKTEEGIRFA